MYLYSFVCLQKIGAEIGKFLTHVHGVGDAPSPAFFNLSLPPGKIHDHIGF